MRTPPVTVRTGTPADRLTVRRILDVAMLEVGDVESRLEAGDVFLAVTERSEPGDGDDERVLGALVSEPSSAFESGDDGDGDEPTGAHITAIAVRRRHRARGVGTALVEAALEREGRLTAHFDADVRPFYESLEFAIERIGDRRYRGECVHAAD